MVQHVRLITSAGFCLSLLMAGCMQGPTGPALSGSITGYVALVNANGSQVTIRDSAMVTVQETNQSVATDSSGKWMISNLKTGTYTIVFTKPGYGMNKMLQFQFTGGSDKNLGTTFLCAPPAFSVANLAWLGVSSARTDSASVYLGVTLTDTGITGPYRVYLVLSPDTNLSVMPSSHSIGNLYTTNFSHGLDSTDIRLTPAAIATDGFAPGDTLYAAAYTANGGTENSSYLDTLTGKTIFTNVNSVRSNVVQIVIPEFTGQSLAGSVSGSVVLVNANGDQPLLRDSIKVSINGTNLVTFTDSSGNWTLPNVKNGTYTLSYTKSGYGLEETTLNQANGANKNVGTVYLCQAPSFSMSELSDLTYNGTRNDSTSIYFGATLSDSTVTGLYRTYLVLSLDSANLSAMPNANETGVFFNTYFRKGEDSTTDFRMTPTTLAANGFESGDTLYGKAFTANAGGINSGYPDSLTGKTIYTNVNANGSNILKFVVP